MPPKKKALELRAPVRGRPPAPLFSDDGASVDNMSRQSSLDDRSDEDLQSLPVDADSDEEGDSAKLLHNVDTARIDGSSVSICSMDNEPVVSPHIIAEDMLGTVANLISSPTMTSCSAEEMDKSDISDVVNLLSEKDVTEKLNMLGKVNSVKMTYQEVIDESDDVANRLSITDGYNEKMIAPNAPCSIGAAPAVTTTSGICASIFALLVILTTCGISPTLSSHQDSWTALSAAVYVVMCIVAMIMTRATTRSKQTVRCQPHGVVHESKRLVLGLLVTLSWLGGADAQDTEILLGICELNPAAVICTNWTEAHAAGVTPCEWQGVTCGSIQNGRREGGEPGCNWEKRRDWDPFGCYGGDTCRSSAVTRRARSQEECVGEWIGQQDSTMGAPPPFVCVRFPESSNCGEGSAACMVSPADWLPGVSQKIRRSEVPDQPCPTCENSDPTRVTALDLHGQRIATLPSEFGELELCWLDVMCTELEELPQIREINTLTVVRGASTMPSLKEFGSVEGNCPWGYYSGAASCKLCPCSMMGYTGILQGGQEYPAETGCGGD